MDGFSVSSCECFEHFLSGRNYFGVSREPGATEEKGFKLGLDVIFRISEAPAFGMRFGGDEVELEGFEGSTSLGEEKEFSKAIVQE